MKGTLAGIVTLLVFGAVAQAEEPVGEAEGSRVSLDMIWAPVATAEVGAMDVHGQMQVIPHLMLDIDVPWAVGEVSGETSAHAGLGNVTPGLHGAWHPKSNLVLSLGVTASVPTTYRIGATNDALGSASVMTYASQVLGSDEWYLFVPEYVSFRIPFNLEVQLSSRWRYQLEVVAGLSFPGGSDVYFAGLRTNDYNTLSDGVWVESASTFEVRLPLHFLLGVRTQFLALTPATPISIVEEGIVGYEPDAGPFVRLSGYLGYCANDSPLPSGLRAAVGYKF